MSGITIHRGSLSELAEAGLDASFDVTQELHPHFIDGRFGYDIVDVEPYRKSYGVDDDEESDGELFIARLAGRPAGAIALSEAWNGYARIDNILVDAKLRRAGVATALLHHAVDWCKGRGLPGLMLETQNNNVAACKLYERFGFRLGGFDVHLYGTLAAPGEIALFWYWHAAA
jgi:streptothricin acetyltransferase